MSLDTRTSDVHSTVSDFGEKFIKTLNQKGRVFVVNDAEGLRHPVASTGSEDITYFVPDDMGASSATASSDSKYNFETTAKDPLSQIQFTMPVGAININFPQAMPAGDLVSYVDTRIKMTMIDLFNREEKILLTGEQNGDGTPRYRSPFYGDGETGILLASGNQTGLNACRYEAGIPTNLPSYLMGGTQKCGFDITDGSGGSASSVDAKGVMFGGIKMSDFPAGEYDQPHVTYWAGDDGTDTAYGAAADSKKLFNTLQNAILTTTYSEVERPTDIWTTLEVFTNIIAGLREDGALPDPVQANMGKEGTIPFGGLNIDWHRYLAASAIWNPLDAAQAELPLLGLNFNSLRLNLVKRGGGMAHDEVGMFESVGDMELAHQLPILYKRVQWKRQLSWDHGRRSNFMLNGMRTTAA
tara:strand:+ start:386 stop:1621 length:1236 start_codon:yes stop_codon:yes gene_type:complete